jgi:probable rRNA maturation factor
MPEAAVHFFIEDVDFKLTQPRKTTAWIKEVIRAEKYKLTELNIIFCADEYLLEINRQYLRHNTFTDIITFNNSDKPKYIEGDIYISVERVRANSLTFEKDFTDELRRVIVHGVLHLLGYGDKNKDQKIKMRAKEDAYLSLFGD